MINQNQLSLLSFCNRWDTGREGIITVDNPAGHCFPLKYLIPMNFFKYHDFEIAENVHHRQNFW